MNSRRTTIYFWSWAEKSPERKGMAQTCPTPCVQAGKLRFPNPIIGAKYSVRFHFLGAADHTIEILRSQGPLIT